MLTTIIAGEVKDTLPNVAFKAQANRRFGVPAPDAKTLGSPKYDYYSIRYSAHSTLPDSYPLVKPAKLPKFPVEYT